MKRISQTHFNRFSPLKSAPRHFSNAANPQREYFYVVDEQGYLYLEETKLKIFTSAFKDVKFLDFFFKRLEPTSCQTYPWMSRCGKEVNFVKAQDTPIVFTQLVENRLYWNHTSMSMAFDASKLFCSNAGRIYHPSPVEFTLGKEPVVPNVHLALVKSSIVIELLGMALDDSFEFQGKTYNVNHADFEINKPSNT